MGGYTATQDYIRNGNNNNDNNNNDNNNNWRASQRNSDLADNGDARASKVIGTGVFNTNNQQLGNVNDILIGKNGVWAVISTNNKKVAVPFNQLEFGNASNGNGNDQIVLPNKTQAQLNTQPVFHYNETNYQGVQGHNNGGWFDNNNNMPITATTAACSAPTITTVGTATATARSVATTPITTTTTTTTATTTTADASAGGAAIARRRRLPGPLTLVPHPPAGPSASRRAVPSSPPKRRLRRRE